MKKFGFSVGVAMVASTICGCATGSGTDLSALQSLDPARRVVAVRTCAAARDPSLTPLVVDRLDDEDLAVRSAAIVALVRMTGERFGYSAGDPIGERDVAVRRWRRFVDQRANGVE
jgi:HEAT repeats